MSRLISQPIFVLVITLIAMWLSANLGALFGHSMRPLKDEERDDFGTVLTSTLTLLGLLIGFTFSMAISRYDQRKNLEEAEANAIGTEYVRVDVLPAADAAKARDLLKKYLDQRILFYKSRDKNELLQINATTAQLQNDLWATVRDPAVAQPNALTGLALAGMNDVLNSQGYTTAAWLNRIPRCGMAVDESDRLRLQLFDRIRSAQESRGAVADRAPCCFYIVLSCRRH